MRVSIKEYREMLEPEDIKNILRKFDVEPVREYPDYIIYPTVNHNLEGGSPKLYYYKRNKMFKSYTGEQRLFDIFQLVMDMHALRGQEISLRESLAFCGIDTTNTIIDTEYYTIRQQLDYMHQFSPGEEEEPEELVVHPEHILERYIYDVNGFSSWTDEGISLETLRRYRIKFDPLRNAIVIPYYTDDNELVGLRGRFLDENAIAKYMPMQYGGKYLAHPTGRILFGLNNNKHAIQKSKTAIIFEGEKSVMKMDTIYGDNNISVAVSGRGISRQHINLLKKYNVKDIIIAFDRDYTSINGLEEEVESIRQQLSFAIHMFNISVIVDYNFLLEHKDSPIDQGKKIFDILMTDRVHL